MKRLILLVSLAALALLTIAPASVAAWEDEHKVDVCKYVGTPGKDETLQTGDNPISVDFHSIPTYDKDNPDKDEPSELVGDEFTDAQGRSLVIGETGHEHPDCPIPVNPTPTPTPTPEPTPTPTPEPTPTPTPTATPAVVELSLVGVCVFNEDQTNDLIWEVTASDAIAIDGELSGSGDTFSAFDIPAGSTLFAFGVKGDGDLTITQTGTDNSATADEPTENCSPDVTPPPSPPVDTGGGPPPPARHTVPPTDTAAASSVSNPTGWALVLLVVVTIVGGALALRPRNR